MTTIRIPTRPVPSMMVYAFLDKEKARADWRSRFENRAPPSASRQPGKLSVRAADSGTTEILLFDEIGYWGVTAKGFAAQLGAISTPSITVRINSPGGDVFDGFAMYNALVAHPAQIHTRVEGLAASAASFIALAGDTVEMADASLMMIHKSWALAIGNADDMTAMHDTLSKIDAQIAAIYAKKCGKAADEMLALMAAETWLDPVEAQDLGLVDRVAEPEAAPADGFEYRILAMKRRLAIAERDD